MRLPDFIFKHKQNQALLKLTCSLSNASQKSFSLDRCNGIDKNIEGLSPEPCGQVLSDRGKTEVEMVSGGSVGGSEPILLVVGSLVHYGWLET